MIKADFHVHTNFSSDSSSEMEDMIKKAINLNLKSICFTEHQDFDFPVSKNDPTLTFQLDTEKYFNKLNILKDKYSKQIEILFGVELGMSPHLSKRYNFYLKKYDFDFIICSSHLVNNLDPYSKEYFERYPNKGGFLKYFENILSNVKIFKNFSVYGHLDYAIRYCKEKELYNPNDFIDIIDEILNKIIYMGNGIELNTAGFRANLTFAHPNPIILKRYKELGGEIITIGSDAHKPEHIAYNFNIVSDILKSNGFSHYTTFKNKKPQFHKL